MLMRWPIGSVPENPRYLTVREAAAVLKVCTATVYKLCERGELPHLRVSNAIRVLASDLATTSSRRRRQ
jgi:excisionase family DNA binding protein